jgi:cystathionine beta-synthase
VGAALGPEHVVVVIIPDSGRGYLSKLYNDEWMADFGFLRAGGQTVADVLSRKSDRLPALVHVHPDETVRTAIEILREYDVSQAPVVKAELPLALAEVVGAVNERDLMDRVFHDPSVLEWTVTDAMNKPLPTIGAGELVDDAVERLEEASAVLVVDAGHPVGILTRSDVLGFLAQRPVAP